MPRKREAKNNNLAQYRERMGERNEALVRRAIKHIANLDGAITFSSVSKVTYEIANHEEGEKGLTLPAISTSKIYRPIVEEAQVPKSTSSQNISSVSRISIGDMQIKLYTLRTENEKLKRDKKILVEKMKEIEVPIPEIGSVDESIFKRYEEIRMVSKSLVDRLLELEIVYIDTNSFTLNVQMFDEIIVTNEALNLFYKKELNELQNTVCK